MKDLNYYKNNAEEDYKGVPISVLRYINELEKQQEIRYNEEELKRYVEFCVCKFNGFKSVSLNNEIFEQFKKK